MTILSPFALSRLKGQDVEMQVMPVSVAPVYFDGDFVFHVSDLVLKTGRLLMSCEWGHCVSF